MNQNPSLALQAQKHTVTRKDCVTPKAFHILAVACNKVLTNCQRSNEYTADNGQFSPTGPIAAAV
jgi:hypothetical protein